MPYKISGTKSETARIIILKESDWSIESNTVISGSGAYEVGDLETGNKSVISRTNDGEVLGYGAVSAEEYVPATGDRGVFGGGEGTTNVIDYVTISTTGDATDFGDLTVSRERFGATSNGVTGRGVFAGGYTAYPARTTTMDYIAILTLGDATDFGDLLTARAFLDGCSNRTNNRGVFGGGITADYSDVLEYITISTTGNAQDFGDLSDTKYGKAACSNGETDRGLFAGGLTGYSDVIDHITISTNSNATNFGDLYMARAHLAATSNGTNDRGVFGGGGTPTATNLIDYVTISTTGNATIFGELTVARSLFSACSNYTSNRGLFVGDINIIDYVTITSTGDAIDFGDLTVARYGVSACSNG